MYTFLTLSRKYRISIAFLLLSLLAVISISLVNSASGGDQSENEPVEVTLHEFVKLSDVDIAFEDQVLVLGTDCDELVAQEPIKVTSMPWLGRKVKLYLYGITNENSDEGAILIEQTVRQINSLQLNCISSPNYLTSLSGSHSVWGSPHDGYGANANIPDIRQQPILSMIKPSSNLTGNEVTVTMFDSFCQGKSHNHLSTSGSSHNHLLTSGFQHLNFQSNNYARGLQATFHLSRPRPKLCGHGEGVISMLQAIAPETNIKLYRVLNDNGFGTLDGLLEALNDFVMESKPVADSVINLSLGVSGDSLVLERVLSAIHQRGTVIVAAAGNFRGVPPFPQEPPPPPPPQYPAAYPFVIGVAASDNDGHLANYANQGDLLAPGGEGDCGGSNIAALPANYNCLAVLNSPSPPGASYWKGSSFSTALVSGVVAELLERDSADMLTPSDVKTILQCSANLEGLVDGSNALQKYNMLTNGIPPCLSAYPDPDERK